MTWLEKDSPLEEKLKFIKSKNGIYKYDTMAHYLSVHTMNKEFYYVHLIPFNNNEEAFKMKETLEEKL